MIIFYLRLLSVFQEKLFAHLFNKITNNDIISHGNSYLSKYIEDVLFNKPLVVDTNQLVFTILKTLT